MFEHVLGAVVQSQPGRVEMMEVVDLTVVRAHVSVHGTTELAQRLGLLGLGRRVQERKQRDVVALAELAQSVEQRPRAVGIQARQPGSQDP